MSFFNLLLVIFCFHTASVYAEQVTCEPNKSEPDWTSLNTNLELKPANVNIILGSNLSDWQEIYELKNVVFGRFHADCGGKWVGSLYTLITTEQPIKVSGEDTIYRTNVPGIGISVMQVYDNRGSKGQAIPAFPNYAYGLDHPVQGAIYSITVKYWKIPGENIPLNNGSVSVVGPEVAALVTANTNSGDTMSTSHTERLLNGGGYSYYIDSSRVLQGTLIFHAGTCNIEGNDIRVNMGDFPGGEHSEWKEASFKLICPDGYGYDGSADAQNNIDNPYNLSANSEITPNSMKNGRVEISIIPYTEVIDAGKGIIALDGTGATGYGIQLAWGDYSSQNPLEPVNPVILNSYVDANTLNSGFGAGDTPIGGNAFNGTDNTIKMSARYVRTTGDAAPGPANAVVQVISNYQ